MKWTPEILNWLFIAYSRGDRVSIIAERLGVTVDQVKGQVNYRGYKRTGEAAMMLKARPHFQWKKLQDEGTRLYWAKKTAREVDHSNDQQAIETYLRDHEPTTCPTAYVAVTRQAAK